MGDPHVLLITTDDFIIVVVVSFFVGALVASLLRFIVDCIGRL